MKKIIFHVGLPKTGTTYIQRKLANNRKVLAEHNIGYHQIDHSLCDCHWWFATNFFSNPLDFSSVQIDLDNGQSIENLISRGEKSKVALTSEVEKYQNVILSAEQFFFLPELVLKNIHEFFNRLNVEIKVVVYVRDFYDLAISEINQKVKMGMGELDYLLLNLPVFGVKKNIEKFVNIFGLESIVIRDFTSLRKCDVDLVQDFLRIIINDNIALKDVGKETNTSLSSSALRIINIINQSGFRAPPHSKERDALIAALAKLNGDPIVPNMDSIDAFYRAISHDIKYLKDIFKINFKEKKPVEIEQYKRNTFSEAEVANALSVLLSKL